MRFLLILGLLLVCLARETMGKRIVCYYTNWAQYRPGAGLYHPEDIDPFLCTHIIYAFTKVVNDHMEPYEWNDLSTPWSKGMYERTMALKNLNPNLKILIAVGGWNHGSGPFSTMVHNVVSRKNFVSTSVQFLKDNKFDGLDVDWEYPGSREESQADDKELFITLLKELKEAFTPHNYLLTGAIGVGASTIENGYDIPRMSQYLDMVNLMTYDLHGSWEDFVEVNAPLYASPDEVGEQAKLNVDWGLTTFLKNGVPRDKINLGLALYGRTFRLTDYTKTDIGSPAKGPGTAGTYTRTDGFASYYEICEKLKQGWASKYSDVQKSAYTYSGNDWIGYDNQQSLSTKANYINDKGLGGAMFWSIDLDDFSGNFCGQGKYPLINNVKSILLNSPAVAPPAVPTIALPPVLPATVPVSAVSPKPVKPVSPQPNSKECSSGDGYFPKLEKKCREYYLCLNSGTSDAQVFHYTCPGNLIFDSKTKGCTFPDSVDCHSEIAPAVPTTTVPIATTTPIPTTTTTPSINHSSECYNGNGYYGNKDTKCATYYYCAFVNTKFERTYHYTCKHGLTFNSALRLCDSQNSCQI